MELLRGLPDVYGLLEDPFVTGVLGLAAVVVSCAILLLLTRLVCCAKKTPTKNVSPLAVVKAPSPVVRPTPEPERIVVPEAKRDILSAQRVNATTAVAVRDPVEPLVLAPRQERKPRSASSTLVRCSMAAGCVSL